MTNLVVEAELREETGRSATRRLRRAGKMPGIIYGGGKPDIAITMEYFTVSKQLNDEQFHTSLLEVKVKGSRTKNTVLLKDAQWDPVMDTATHLDFFRVSAKDTVTVDVPVVTINAEKCPGVVKGGLIDLVRHSLEVSCRADTIPDSIEVDCDNMEIGDTVHIEDITLPEGAVVHHDVNFTVLNIAAPKTGSDEDEDEAETVEETAVEPAAE
ncbi:50S ribosomal protein L25/general stress protein Ctc [Mariprofundus sp. EBB-1]|uniref:50S ribosomal protein L25/general stress protein Ctc n=1 Tax=Mariprofundus sp. EBB-1 TaxID=2650971 RepID=UPI000EF194ED|nr:50S ribosomal protein L25/general stress protein Ctc [Mariprofundus sp. EBB-1]RLL54975.1 50S ribosomal protein L25/general stress protein Ctc [Mariprofundus sp. EBB-1]